MKVRESKDKLIIWQNKESMKCHVLLLWRFLLTRILVVYLNCCKNYFKINCFLYTCVFFYIFHLFIIVFFCFVLFHTWWCSGDMWLCTQESLQTVFERPYMMLGIEAGQITYKANALPTGLWLQPLSLCFEHLLKLYILSCALLFSYYFNTFI